MLQLNHLRSTFSLFYSLQSCPVAASKKNMTQTTTVKSTPTSISFEKTDEDGNIKSLDVKLGDEDSNSELQTVEQKNVASVSMGNIEDNDNENQPSMTVVEPVYFKEAEQAIQRLSEDTENISNSEVQQIILVNEKGEKIVTTSVSADNQENIPEQCDNVQIEEPPQQSLGNEQSLVEPMDVLELSSNIQTDSEVMHIVATSEIDQSPNSTSEIDTAHPSHIVIEHLDLSKSENPNTESPDVQDISNEIQGESEFQVVAEWSGPSTESTSQENVQEDIESINKEETKEEFSKEDQTEENKGIKFNLQFIDINCIVCKIQYVFKLPGTFDE